MSPKKHIQTDNEITDRFIKIIALDCGFKLKEQLDGSKDLHPYVYNFARGMVKEFEQIEVLKRKELIETNRLLTHTNQKLRREIEHLGDGWISVDSVALTEGTYIVCITDKNNTTLDIAMDRYDAEFGDWAQYPQHAFYRVVYFRSLPNTPKHMSINLMAATFITYLKDIQ